MVLRRAVVLCHCSLLLICSCPSCLLYDLWLISSKIQEPARVIGYSIDCIGIARRVTYYLLDPVQYATLGVQGTESLTAVVKVNQPPTTTFLYTYKPPQNMKVFRGCSALVIRCFKRVENFADWLTGAAGPLFVFFCWSLIGLGGIAFCQSLHINPYLEADS